MQSFQYAEQQSNPRYIDRIMEDPLPPFRPARSCREEFNARAAEIVAVFPELEPLGSGASRFPTQFRPRAPEKVSFVLNRDCDHHANGLVSSGNTRSIISS